jgi:hypothetical protein
MGAGTPRILLADYRQGWGPEEHGEGVGDGLGSGDGEGSGGWIAPDGGGGIV